MRASTIQTDRGPFAALESTPPAGVRAATAVVLVPGYTGSKEDFLAVLAPLAAAGHRAVALDLRGQHETPGSADPEAYELTELAADVLAVVRTVGGAAHLVGHSFGGFVARTAALLAEGQPVDGGAVRSLTLFDSGPGPVTGHGTRMTLGMLADALPVHDLPSIWAVKRALEEQRGDPALPPEIEEFLRTRFCGNHPTALTVAAGQLTAAEDRAEALAALAVPILVLYGSAEDVWSPDELAAMADRLGAHRHVVVGAGHSPAVDDPVDTAAALVRFWRVSEEARHRVTEQVLRQGADHDSGHASGPGPARVDANR